MDHKILFIQWKVKSD